MISLVLLVVVVAVVVALVVTAQHSKRTPALDVGLGDWVAAGLIDDRTAAEIRRFEAARQPVPAQPAQPAQPTEPTEPTEPTAPTRTAVPTRAASSARPTVGAAVEALGYLGGVLAVSGLVLLVASFWEDLAVGGQLAISGLTAAALIAGGRAVPEHHGPAMDRLRAFLWTLGTAGVAVFAAVVGRELGAPAPAARVTAITAGSVAVTSAVMWSGRFRPVQHLVALAAGVVAVGASFELLGGHVGSGIAVWLAGAALVVVGWRCLTRAPVIDIGVGSIAMGVGSVIAIGDDPQPRLLVVAATGLLLVGLALAPRLIRDTASIVVLAVVGGALALQSVPPAIAYFANDAGVVTGLAVWLCGAGLLALGIRRVTRAPLVPEVLGGLVMLVGSAVTAAQSPGFATLFGLGTALVLLGGSMVPGRVALAPVGAIGLLVNVPWAISWFFPGEGRVPLLISVSGVLIIAVAVLMARLGHRFGSELGRRPTPQAR